MIIESCETYRVDIFIAGDLAQAKQVCREHCFEVGLCVTVEPVTYIYTGVVALRNLERSGHIVILEKPAPRRPGKWTIVLSEGAK